METASHEDRQVFCLPQEVSHGTKLSFKCTMPYLQWTAPCQCKTRVIFDYGSQRSYVTDQLKSSLDLPVRSVDTLMIRTCGSSEKRVQTCEVVDLQMETRGSESLQLSFLAVPLISKLLVNQRLSHAVEAFPHLSGLDLADTGGEADIDV